MTPEPPASAGPSSGLPSPGTVAPLRAIGLTDREARVLAHVLESVESSHAEIAVATGLPHTAASLAVTELRARGLIDRVERRRPAVVFVSPAAADSVALLLSESDARRQEESEQAEQAVALVRAAAARSARRGRPLYEVVPARDPHGDAQVELAWGLTSRDEVLDSTPPALSSRGSFTSCATRLLLVEPDARPLAAMLERLAAVPHRHSVEVRVAAEARPELLLIDRERLRVTATGTRGRVHAWTRDPLHVAAAAQLFGSWWAEGEPVLELAPTPAPPFDESELEVDEWDPAELDRTGPGPAGTPPDERGHAA